MNEYHINILEQMGYEVTNPDFNELGIVRKGSRQELKKVINGKSVVYSDDSNDFELSITTAIDDITIKFKGVEVSMTCCPDYHVSINDGNNKWLYLSGDICRDDSDLIGYIDCSYDTSGWANVHQGLTGISLSYGKGNKEFNKEFIAPDCTIERILQFIIEFLGRDSNVENSITLQKGLIYVIPAFTKFINDMLERWKNNLPELIKIIQDILEGRKSAKEYYDREVNRLAQVISDEESIIARMQEFNQKYNTSEEKTY